MKPVPLDSVFKEKIFRIPDYQRGYAWGKEKQLKDFWEDLINLSDDDNRSHYTGVLTLKKINKNEVKEDDKEYWLVEDHSYEMYHIVDGQQRLTTFIIFLQSFIDFIKQIPDNKNKKDGEIFISDSLNISSIVEKFIYKIKPTGDNFRTYKFGYSVDNPSYEFLRYNIFHEEAPGSIKRTFYTLNLKNAQIYFTEQIKELYQSEGSKGLEKIYKKLTKRFLFNEYIIEDEFDVFVAFETMNNRGKNLSDLELLKNRLIYLTTLYEESELDAAERKSLRDSINDAWKEVYHQLGRNEKHPLNDDDFLKAHWIMYFTYTRKKGNDYIHYLLDNEFSTQKVYKKIEKKVSLEIPEEQRTDFEIDLEENDNNDEESVETKTVSMAQLNPAEIKEYVSSLKESALHWFNSHYPDLAEDLTDEERKILDKLNRVGMGYFRPFVMSLFKNETDSAKRIDILNKIERFIFIVFRLCRVRRNYGDSEFYNAAKEFDKGEINLNDIEEKLNERSDFAFNEDGSFDINDFYNYILKKFNEGENLGFYKWSGLKYFLYEYELSLLTGSRQQKVFWADLLKNPKDQVSIEHILPQTSTDYWDEKFSDINSKQRKFYTGSLGNLLLLSAAINSSLQNDSFEDKKNPKFDDGKKTRNGYSDGSHSEIEVSRYNKWDSAAIKERGLNLLNFMENRWNIKFKDKEQKIKLLFLNHKDNE
jgi:uncharacterized protein with ParB-like and HNH nuclease domain